VDLGNHLNLQDQLHLEDLVLLEDLGHLENRLDLQILVDLWLQCLRQDLYLLVVLVDQMDRQILRDPVYRRDPLGLERLLDPCLLLHLYLQRDLCHL
jgi:hypothetical protein